MIGLLCDSYAVVTTMARRRRRRRRRLRICDVSYRQVEKADAQLSCWWQLAPQQAGLSLPAYLALSATLVVRQRLQLACGVDRQRRLSTAATAVGAAAAGPGRRHGRALARRRRRRS